jgi:hypothetical protein
LWSWKIFNFELDLLWHFVGQQNRLRIMFKMRT